MVSELLRCHNRWAADGYAQTPTTVWYGQMCRSSILFERIIRRCHATFRSALRNDSSRSMTMGECFYATRMLAPQVMDLIHERLPGFGFQNGLLPRQDSRRWHFIIALRNKLMHEGPGFLESTDMHAGRRWSKDAWSNSHSRTQTLSQSLRRVGQTIAFSPLVAAAAVLEGREPATTRRELEAILADESSSTDSRRIDYATMPELINEFHSESR